MTAMSSPRHLQVMRNGISFAPRARAERDMGMLVVEDEAQIRAFLARAFEAEGFAGRCCRRRRAGTPRCAYGDLRVRHPLPAAPGTGRPGGAAPAAPLRHHDVPVLILSARSDIANQAARLRAGCGPRLHRQAVLARRGPGRPACAPVQTAGAPAASRRATAGGAARRRARAGPDAAPGAGWATSVADLGPTASSASCTSSCSTPAR